jgi:hypothetical protein
MDICSAARTCTPGYARSADCSSTTIRRIDGNIAWVLGAVWNLLDEVVGDVTETGLVNVTSAAALEYTREVEDMADIDVLTAVGVIAEAVAAVVTLPI